MRRFMLSCLVVASLLFGIPCAEAVKLEVVVPSEGSRLLASTRDFYAIVAIDREGKNPEQERFNVHFELYRDGDLDAVRTVSSIVDNITGLTPLNAVKLDYEHGQTPGEVINILSAPPPDLVFDPSRPASFYDATVKAVVTRHYAAALIQGGNTKEFDTNYPTIYTRDLEEGAYTLKVKAVGEAGAELHSVTVPLTFGTVPDKIISRFSPPAHVENVEAFAQVNNSHIYSDPFPGYWDASTLPHGGGPSDLFYEINRRWRPNDLLEYMGGTIRAVLYNVAETSATNKVELGGLAYNRRLNSQSIHWYMYDTGEVVINYNAGGSQTAVQAGKIVPFPEGRKLAMVRAEVRGDGVDRPEPSDNVYYPELADKTVDWNVEDGVVVKAKQMLSLFGVVKPLQPSLEDVVREGDGTYTMRNRIEMVRYVMKDEATEKAVFEEKWVELVRPETTSRPSIYEFRHDLLIPDDFDKPWTVELRAFDSHGMAVPGTDLSFVITPRPAGGGGGGGGCDTGAAPFAVLLLIPLLYAASRRGAA
ncbi:MAG: SYNERG-CTERM sorting domain-containing protein [Synergistaceae bacterium]|nr:Synerg-CTERM sorting domain-containing protein [Synergistota bacterium]NLM70573.1 SYNERG-CTERM sorting domain-containing protein [Synergistaceae bacterium]